MLEHIFRNMTDIRVFDVFYGELFDGEEVDIDDILKRLEYPYCAHIQIEDSVEHLVKQHILDEVYIIVDGYGGCRTCSYTDKLKLPRIGKHKNHVPYETCKTQFPFYRIAVNDVTNYLWQALFESTRLYAKEVQKEIEKEKEENKQ